MLGFERDGRCSTTEVSSTNGSGMAYDFNNEYRDTNDNTESREGERHSRDLNNQGAFKKCNIAARMSSISTYGDFRILTHLLGSSLHAMIQPKPGFSTK
jgi:hypothetical protein